MADLYLTLVTSWLRRLAPLAHAAESDVDLPRLLARLGWEPAVLGSGQFDAVTERLGSLTVIVDSLEDFLREESFSFVQVFDVVDSCAIAVKALREPFSAGNDTIDGFADIGIELLRVSTDRYIQEALPLVHSFLRLFTLCTYELTPPTPLLRDDGMLFRLPTLLPMLQLRRLKALFSNPFHLLRNEYASSDRLATTTRVRQVADALFPVLGDLLVELGARVTYGIAPGDDSLFDPTTRELARTMLTFTFTGPSGRFGASLAFSAADTGNEGLVIIPLGDNTFASNVGLWSLNCQTTSDVQAFSIGPAGPRLLTTSGSTTHSMSFSMEAHPVEQMTPILFGDLESAHLQLAAPAIGLAINIDTATNSQEYDFSLSAGGGGLSLPGLVELVWDDLRWKAGRQITTLSMHSLRLSADLIPGLKIAGDLELIFKNGALQTGSTLVLREPEATTLPLNDFSFDSDCFILGWQEPDVNRWLRRAAGDLAGDGPPTPSAVTLRAIVGRPLREIRLDWAVAGGAQKLHLPGLQVTTPATALFSLVWTEGAPGVLDRLALVLTLEAGAVLVAASTFAWTRDDERELQNDGARSTKAPPLFELKLVPARRTSVVLLDLSLAGGQLALPRLFRQLATPLEPLASDPAAPCLPVDFNTAVDLGTGWQAFFTVNAQALDDAFEMPFLKNGPLGQVISITAPKITNLGIDLAKPEVPLPFDLQLRIGELAFNTTLRMKFNLRSFALAVEHTEGIKLYSEEARLLDVEYLGLRWRFTAPIDPTYVPIDDNDRGDKRHYLTLVTANNNYQVIQAPGSLMELEFGAISEEPIVFLVRDFTLNGNGISLKASVSPEPVRLLGLGTKFSFRDSELILLNNQIQELSLGGSGALPPALVGDAAVNILLRFARNDKGNLALIGGEAGLALNKPLECRLSRFRFTLSRLDVGFVLEGKFHLYFMLTGSAEFALQEGDDVEGPLALLPKIKIDLVKAPLTGDVSVIGKYVDFLITLPRPISFSFLSCFEMEVRSIGFRPQAEVFDGDGAMQIGGQIRFAQGDGDEITPQRDLHSLYIGLPKPGDLFPRIYLNALPLRLSIPGAFQIEAVVNFVDTESEEGFKGTGKLDIRGMPNLEAAFSFVRVRRDGDGAWVRAWFIALNVGKLAVLIPVVQIYIREIGLGFGYRYTVTALKTADEIADVKQLIAALDKISRTQGDLARLDSWKTDIEAPGRSLRWTIAFRAMIAQSAGSVGVGYDDTVEEQLSCLYLFDAIFVFRSDFTFFINARGWVNTNYHDYLRNVQNTRSRPFVTGYMLLQPAQKRFLARLVNNPSGSLGLHPKMPNFIETALRSVRFSITLLVEPGLVHLDMGWPDKLRWRMRLGPLSAEYRGGMIFRVVYRGGEKELVIGVSSLVRATLDFRAELDLGFIGVRIRVYADVSYSLRYIGVLSLSDPFGESAFYGRIGLEIRVRLELTAWIDVWLFSVSATLTVEVHIGAALELAINGIKPDGIGLRGTANLGLEVFGHSLGFGVDLAVGRENVEAVIARTARYDAMGLSSDEPTDALPPPPGTPAENVQGSANLLGAALEEQQVVLGWSDGATLELPDYTLFVLPQGSDYLFVFFPRGEPTRLHDKTLRAARGFLPVPPGSGEPPEADFRLYVPGAGLAINTRLTQLRVDPGNTVRETPVEQRDAVGNLEHSWQVNWEAIVVQGVRPPEADQRAKRNPDGNLPPRERGFTLREYFRQMFAGEIGSLHDPQPLGGLERDLEDARVNNPSDADYEAAVRGAFEQFRGSPYFKFDPNSEYDQALAEAFAPDTTPYSEDGKNPADPAAQQLQRISQLRGMVIQAIVDDLRAYVADPASFATKLSQSIAFQMGLVFRCTGPTPAWLTGLQNEAQLPRLSQRLGEGSRVPEPLEGLPNIGGYLRLFNTDQTSFAAYPPAFNRLRSYTSANTIAIGWNLAWDHLVNSSDYSQAQANPNHHLAYYEVQRRALDSSERVLSYRVKPAPVLHRRAGKTGIELLRILPRFQVVDHFNYETPAEQAALPVTGLRYLYTITPVDYAGRSGRPLSLVATRYPDAPPQVPAEALLTLEYQLAGQNQKPEILNGPPTLLTPSAVRVDWEEPPPPEDGPQVPISHYRLVFRRERTLPVGSYGLNSATSGDSLASLPASYARTRPSDLVLELAENEKSITPQRLVDLQVFPKDGLWRAEAWQVFIQAVAFNGTLSSLAPVQIALAFVRSDPQTKLPRSEERRPPNLEWLPVPCQLPLLPPEDQRAQVGDAHVPMPFAEQSAAATAFHFGGTIGQIKHRKHPAALRNIRFRWNQGPANLPRYPLDLHAGYRLLELDIDAHTDQTFDDQERLAAALRQIQEVQLIPARQLLTAPADTLATSRWEAWYPSAVRRHQQALAEQRELPYGPWYSWRDSILEWPLWPELTVSQRYEYGPDGRRRPVVIKRKSRFHPFLSDLLERLAGRCFEVSAAEATALNARSVSAALSTAFGEQGFPLSEPQVTVLVPAKSWEIRNKGSDTPYYLRTVGELIEVYRESDYIVDQMAVPPTQAGDLAALLAATPPTADPYGWGVLQQMGLSVTFSLRDKRTREPVAGATALTALHEFSRTVAFKKRWGTEFERFLHIEALFQPGSSIELGVKDADPLGLLGVVQVSLRPALRQVRSYGQVIIELPSPRLTNFELVFELGVGQTCSVIDMRNPAGGQIELRCDDATKPPSIPIFLPKGGGLDLRVRAISLPPISLRIPPAAGNAPVTMDYVKGWEPIAFDTVLPEGIAADSPLREAIFGAPTLFAPTDDRAANFTVPESLASEFASFGVFTAEEIVQRNWFWLKRYLESLNLESSQAIGLPIDEAGIEQILPAVLGWLQRFFDYAGLPTPLDLQKPAGMAAISTGPWLASAYPRAGSPALTAPDSAGRVRYDHLLGDRWGHLLRYYLQPTGRYEQLWAQVLTSPVLFGEQETVQAPAQIAQPNPDHGALDVVVKRTAPLAAPVVLRSARLDEPSAPGAPAPPGPTWEVIVAEHPEQRLVESNQTLARRMEFRQIAFTLLRRFAYGWWVGYLAQKELLDPQHYADPAHVYPLAPQTLPGEYPEVLDHIQLKVPEAPSTAYSDAIRSLELPLRVPHFQQGYMALQWQGLPFYYQHRLLLIAQAADQVSPVAEVIQGDFAYRSAPPEQTTLGGHHDPLWRRGKLYFPPEPAPPPVDPPAARVSMLADEDEPPPPPPTTPMRGRQVRIPLRSFWESLPDEARATWPAEDPAQARGVPAGVHKTGALPDPEVVYQLIERFSGNVEVQVEFFYNQQEAPAEPPDPENLPNQYIRRQLGRRFLATMPSLAAPVENDPERRYALETVLYAQHEEPLSQAYSLPEDPALRERIEFRERTLLVYGVFRLQDRDALLALMDAANEQQAQDRARITALYESWWSEEVLSAPLDLSSLGEPLRNMLEAPAPTECVLVWHGPLSNSQRDELLAALEARPPQLLDGDDEFKAAFRRLLRMASEAAAGSTSRVVAPPGLDQVPGGLDEGVTITAGPTPQLKIVVPAIEGPGVAEPAAVSTLTVSGDATHYTAVEWQGPLYERQNGLLQANLPRWSSISAFRAAVERLLQTIETRTIEQPIDAPRPQQADLPEAVRSQLLITEPRGNIAGTLRWEGAGPDGTQRSALAGLVADTGFTTALASLLAQIDRPPLEASLPEPGTVEAPILGDPAVELPDPFFDLPEPLRVRLELIGEGEERKIRWPGPLPDATLQQLIDAYLAAPPEGAEALAAALRAISDDLNGRRQVPLPAGPRRPTLAELGNLADQLSLGLRTISWRGRLQSHADRQALFALSTNTIYAQDIRAGLTAILGALEAALSEPLDLPRRRLIDPPAWLSEQLLIGVTRLRYHGLMERGEGQALRALCTTAPDRAAIQRLYEASLAKGMRGRALFVRSRRGSAAPSEALAIEVEQLA
jgi:hypothetical protein